MTAPAMSQDRGNRRVMSMRETAKAVLRLASGSAGAQGIQLGAMVVLARSLEPQIFGDYAVFVGYGTILAGVGGLKLEQAVQIQAIEARARDFARSALLVGVPVTIVLAGLLAAIQHAGWLPGGRGWQASWLISLPSFAWLGIAINTATAWHIRRARFALVSRLRWFPACTIAAFQIGGALLHLGIDGQIWGSVLGTALGFGVVHAGLLRERLRRRSRPGSLQAHATRATGCLVEWREHSVNLVLAAFCGTVAWQVPSVLLHEFWGAAAAGYYAIAFRISSAPLAFIQAAVGDIIVRETTIRLNTGADLRRFVSKSTFVLVAGATAIAVTVVILCPWVMPRVLGANWDPVVKLLPWLMLSFVFRVVGGTLSLFVQTGHTRLLLVWQAAFMIGHLATFGAAHVLRLDLVELTMFVAFVHTCFYLFLAVANLVLSHRPPNNAACHVG